MAEIRILVDQHIPFTDSCFSSPFVLDAYDPNEGPSDRQLNKADALLIRTVTKVDENLINKAPSLKIVCSATAGYDHLNSELLKSHNIRPAWAPGCNARSVAEYVASGLIVWAEERQLELSELTVGIIGEGHAGSATRRVLEKLGCRCISHDPPRQEREPGWQSADIADVLRCDVLTFHTGLDQYPEHPTFHWLNQEKLRDCRAGLIINAARGGVIDEKALLEYQRNNPVDTILDVWEHEPRLSVNNARSAWLSTPHIAGYSRQSKYRGTRMSAEAINSFFGVSSRLQKELPAETKFPDYSRYLSTAELIRNLHPAFPIHENLQKIALEPDADQRSSLFLNLRVQYPSPDEWQALEIPKSASERFPELAALSSP